MMNVHQAKSQLSKLLDAAERGEDVIITRRGSHFKLVHEGSTPADVVFGALKHELTGGEPDVGEADRALDEIFTEYFERPEREE